MSGWRKAAFYTGNIDENDKNFWISTSPRSQRTAYLRDVRWSLVLEDDKPVVKNISDSVAPTKSDQTDDDNTSDKDI